MKRIAKIISLLLIVFITSNSFVSAQTYSENTTCVSHYTEQLSDGYYLEVYIEESIDLSNSRAMSSKTGTKTYVIYDDNSDTVAKFVLTARYNYNGYSVSCLEASHSTTIYDDSWKFTSASSTYSDNVATGKFTAKKYVLFVVTDTVSKTINLTCDKNGNLS